MTLDCISLKNFKQLTSLLHTLENGLRFVLRVLYVYFMKYVLII